MLIAVLCPQRIICLCADIDDYLPADDGKMMKSPAAMVMMTMAILSVIMTKMITIMQMMSLIKKMTMTVKVSCRI